MTSLRRLATGADVVLPTRKCRVDDAATLPVVVTPRGDGPTDPRVNPVSWTVLVEADDHPAQRSRFSAPRVGRAQHKSPAWSGEKGMVAQGGIEPPTRGFSDLG